MRLCKCDFCKREMQDRDPDEPSPAPVIVGDYEFLIQARKAGRGMDFCDECLAKFKRAFLQEFVRKLEEEEKEQW